MNDRVTVQVSEHVAEVMLDRAQKFNALDADMFTAICHAIDKVAADASVRAVVLHGAGDNFCSGIDVSIMADRSLDFREALTTPLTPSIANLFQKVAYGWRELKVPVICAIQGITYGGGLQIALGADVRIAAPNARLSIMESKWGLIPDMGLSATLRGLVAPDRAKELAWSARVVAADEAHAIGLVTTIDEQPLSAARRMARDIAERSPNSMQGIKALVNGCWGIADSDALAMEARLQGAIMGSKNQIEAVSANFEKRAPVFVDG